MTKNSKIDSHFSKYYDEKQLVDRYRISFETMMLTFLLISICGMIKIFHGPWAADNTEMVILLSIPFTYFSIRSVLKGAYFSRDKNHTLVLILFAFIGIINIATVAISVMGGKTLIENGMLTENLFQLFIALPFFAIIVSYLIKKMINKNIEEDE